MFLGYDECFSSVQATSAIASPALIFNCSSTSSYHLLFMLLAITNSAVGMAQEVVNLLWNCGKLQPGLLLQVLLE